MKKAVMFGLDGTLVFQTKDYIFNTVGKTLSELGLSADEKFVDDFWYCHYADRDKIIEDRLGIEYMKFWKIFWKYDTPEERIKHTGVYDDVAVLKNLKEKGLKLVDKLVENIENENLKNKMIEIINKLKNNERDLYF